MLITIGFPPLSRFARSKEFTCTALRKPGIQVIDQTGKYFFRLISPDIQHNTLRFRIFSNIKFYHRQLFCRLFRPQHIPGIEPGSQGQGILVNIKIPVMCSVQCVGLLGIARSQICVCTGGMENVLGEIIAAQR